MKKLKSIMIISISLVCMFLISTCSGKAKKTAGVEIAEVKIYLCTYDEGSVIGAVVKLQHNADSTLVFEKIADDKCIVFPTVDFGVYTLTVTLEHYATFTDSELYIDYSPFEHEVTLMELRGLAVVNISLTTNDGGSVLGAVVTLQNSKYSELTFKEIANDNGVSFNSVEFGRYTLTVFHNDYANFINEDFYIEYEIINQPIALAKSNEDLATVKLEIKTSNNGSVAGAIVRLQNSFKPSLFYQANTINNNVSFFNVEYGTYILTITHGFYDLYTLPEILISKPVMDFSVMLQSNHLSIVSIEIKTVTKAKIIGASIRLVNNNGNLSNIYEAVAINNIASMPNVAYGNYTLTVIFNSLPVFIKTNFPVYSRDVNETIELEILANVTVDLTTNFNVPAGSVVSISNNNGDDQQYFRMEVDQDKVLFKGVLWGYYTLQVTHHELFHTYIFNDFVVLAPVVSRTVHLVMRGPAGGFVFYDKGYTSEGWRYIEAAPIVSEVTSQWGTQGHEVEGTLTDVGSGKRNTELIVAKCYELLETGKAAQVCTAMNINSYTGWTLPSKDELNLMYLILKKNNIGGFQDTWYWSSSQDNSNLVWHQHFGEESQSLNSKTNMSRVRGVRRF